MQKFADADAEITFMQAVRDGIFRHETLSEADLARIVALMGQFRDFTPGAADASAIAVAERLKIQEIASMDGPFGAVRPRGVDFFTLAP